MWQEAVIMPFLKFKCESCGKVFDELVNSILLIIIISHKVCPEYSLLNTLFAIVYDFITALSIDFSLYFMNIL